jgi:hypothetical protein
MNSERRPKQVDQNSTLARLKSFRVSLFSVIAFAFLTIILFSAQTYAFFTDGIDNQQNQIASGTLKIELIQMREAGTGETTHINPVEVMPATQVSKIVMVRNAGTLPVYIRIKIEKDINKQDSALPENWEDLITCDFNLDNIATDVKEGHWTYQDGYYYYNAPLAVGAITEPLFEQVLFSAQMGNEFANSEIYFTVRCEATQVNGNGNSPMNAIGWPVAQGTNTGDHSAITDSSEETLSGETTN